MPCEYRENVEQNGALFGKDEGHMKRNIAIIDTFPENYFRRTGVHINPHSCYF